MLYKVPIAIRLDGFAWIEINRDVLPDSFIMRLNDSCVRCVAVEELRVENNPLLDVKTWWGAEPVESGQLPHVVRGMKLIKRREL